MGESKKPSKAEIAKRWDKTMRHWTSDPDTWAGSYKAPQPKPLKKNRKKK